MFSTSASPSVSDRTERAVRAQRLVQAARDLADEHHSAGFTVHEVAARAGSSLKGFYGCFAGKDDLLVALLAEDSRIGAGILAEQVEAQASHGDRVRACVAGLFELSALPGAEGYTRVLVTEHRRLSEGRPDDMRSALAPIVDVITTTIDAATRAGAAQSASPARDAHTIFSLVLDGIHDVSVGRRVAREHAAYLWRFCGRALGVPEQPRSPISPTEPLIELPEEP